MIIIKTIILYFIQIAHTDHFPSTGARLVDITFNDMQAVTHSEMGVAVNKGKLGKSNENDQSILDTLQTRAHTIKRNH